MEAGTTQLRQVPFDSDRWNFNEALPTPAEYLGRPCVHLGTSTATLADANFANGVIEVDLAVGPERGFHGLFWRARDDENFESFVVRPHQVGNTDAVQYTPVVNGLSSWQLYHGPGFWAPISFPLDDWFRIRVAFAGERAEVFVDDLDEPALTIRELKGAVEPGRVGVFVGGPAIHLARFAYDSDDVRFSRPTPPAPPALTGIVPAWSISDAIPEEALTPSLDRELLATRTWSRLASEPSGLADLARVHGIRDGRNTVFARATIGSSKAQAKPLELGFSDRAIVYLNGEALYRGNDTYRSRDYRFLGSIGYYDTLYVPLLKGDNHLVVAVSEDFGGWGVQARFPDVAGLAFASI